MNRVFGTWIFGSFETRVFWGVGLLRYGYLGHLQLGSFGIWVFGSFGTRAIWDMDIWVIWELGHLGYWYLGQLGFRLIGTGQIGLGSFETGHMLLGLLGLCKWELTTLISTVNKQTHLLQKIADLE